MKKWKHNFGNKIFESANFGRTIMKKRKLLVLTSMAIVITIIFSVSMPYTYASSSSTDISALRNQENVYTQKLNEAKKVLSDKTNQKVSEETIKSSYEAQAQIVQSQIDNLTNQLNDLNSTIAQNDTSINNLQSDINKNMDSLKQMIRTNYMLGEASNTELLLGASNIYDFLSKYQIVESLTKHQNDLMDTLKNEQTVCVATKSANVQSENDLALTNSQLGSKRVELANDITQKTASIKQLTTDVATSKSTIDAYTADLNAVNDKIDNASKNSVGAFVGGVFAWPVPGYSLITSPFGMRTNPITHLWSLHTGIDISGPAVFGKPIVAANDGVVKLANNTTDGAYGRYVLIDHGGGFMTFYGHCDTIAVSVGQKVSKGQTIATVGNTGWSTGAHLHFEIRIPVNGVTTPVNPMNYYTKN